MAFGFPFASYKEKIATTGDKETVRRAVLEAFKALSWTPEPRGPDQYRAFIRDPDWRSYDEYVMVTLLDGAVLVKSRCAYVQAIDYGKNKEHVEEFKSQLLQRR